MHQSDMKKENVRTIDLLKEGTMLPPAKDKCQQCAVKHDEQQAHDANSLYYQFWFKKQHDRFPTWNDAIDHCSPEVKEFWKKQLKAHGVKL